MTVRVSETAIHLEGRCLVEDSEALVVAIQENPAMPVDLSSLQRLHMAVVQVLLVLKPRVAGPPADPFLAKHIFHLLIANDKSGKHS